MTKGRIQAVLSFFLALTLSGCAMFNAASGIRDYEPANAPGRSFGPYSLGVLPVEDHRPPSETQGSAIICDFLSPFYPIGSETVTRPEDEYAKPAAGQPSPLAPVIWQSVTAELAHDRLVERTFAVSPQGPDLYQVSFFNQEVPAGTISFVKRPVGAKVEQPVQPQLLIKPTLMTEQVNRKLYCFIPFVGALMFPSLGAPFGKEIHTLNLRLDLVAASDPSKTLWTYDIDESASGFVGFYYLTGTAPNALDQDAHDLVAAGMRKAVPDLTDFLSHQTPSFWQKLGSGETVVEEKQKRAAPSQARPWWQ